MERFLYDVFLSHSSKDNAIVRDIAERLRSDNVRVWFDEWNIDSGDDIPAKIERGLKFSRVLVLCLSSQALGSDWSQLEAGTFRFRDPINKGRRFVPLRLDNSPVHPTLANFLHIDWRPEYRDVAYPRLLRACQLPPNRVRQMPAARYELAQSEAVKLRSKSMIRVCVFSPDGLSALTGGDDHTVRLWDLKTGNFLAVFEGHKGDVWSIAWSADRTRALSGSHDTTIRLWNIDTGLCIGALRGHTKAVRSVAWSPDYSQCLSGSDDRTIRLWDLESSKCIRVLQGHSEWIRSVAWSADQRRALSASTDSTVRLWNLITGQCERVFEGHTKQVRRVEWSNDQRFAFSCSDDMTIRVWDVESGNCIRVFEGNQGEVLSIALSADQKLIVSGASDNTVRLWEVESGICLGVLKGHRYRVRSVGWSGDTRRAFSSDNRGGIRLWNLDQFIKPLQSGASTQTLLADSDHVQYTNAKVLLVGESGVGKTGLANRLASDSWNPSDSTVGAWATQCRLPAQEGESVQREIWLWDFGGQADQRLIHQLYMGDTALAALVFDGQKENLFETLGQWDRDLTRSSPKTFTKLLVAGRVDVGSFRVSRDHLRDFAKERGYEQIIETSAKTGHGCEELKHAIVESIDWDRIPWRSSPTLFKRLKEGILELKEAGRTLMRFKELRQTLELHLLDQEFTDDDLGAVLSLLAGPGVVWELKFGTWVLLQPELINTYAQAVIQTLRDDPQDRGCILETAMLKGTLKRPSVLRRLAKEDERIMLLAVHQTLVEHALCLREQIDEGTILVFPSYYRRERPELVGHPTVQVSYRFNGFLDDIYATLVVRLHHTHTINKDELWRYAADFKTPAGKQLGVKLRRLQEGAGELEVYFDPTISTAEKITFSRFVHEHLMHKGQDVQRFRHYVCPYCATPAGNREVAMKRLAAWQASQTEQASRGYSEATNLPTMICQSCEKRIPLWDEMEQSFASIEIQQRVRKLEDKSLRLLQDESRERTVVGEIVSTVLLAGQIVRELATPVNGLDLEIEFKDDVGKPTGLKVYITLNRGQSSFLLRRGKGRTQILSVNNEEHVQSWIAQQFPVLVVLQAPGGEICWMEVRDWLKREIKRGKKPIHTIFQYQRLDVMSVRNWRNQEMGDPLLHYNRDSLLDVLNKSSSEKVRCEAARRLAAWPDDDIRDRLSDLAHQASGIELRIACCEALINGWWKELGIRRWIRRCIATELQPFSERLIAAVRSSRKQLSGYWESILSDKRTGEKEPQMVAGYPAFRITRFRLRNIGPFIDTGEMELNPDINIFLGDNAAGKSTIMRCLALAGVGLGAANEIVDNAHAYLRKGAQQGSIEVLFELIPDPDAFPWESGHFNVGLEISAESSRFTATRELTLLPDLDSRLPTNSAETLGNIRSKRNSGLGFVCGYGAVRTFGESRFAIQTELKKPENEWVLSLFKPEAWLVNPEVFSKLLRGDTSNIEGGPAGGLSNELSTALRKNLQHLFPEVTSFFSEGDDDLELKGTSLRFGELSDGYRSLFALIGHLLRSSLKLKDWSENPTDIHGIALIDEMDLHLHPAWQTHAVEDFRHAFPHLQVIASTHSPLLVSALKRENVLIMQNDDDGSVVVSRPDFDPQGLGVAGILTGIFSLSSTIDQPTLDKITKRLLLHARRDEWTTKDKLDYETLTRDLSALGFNREFADPYYERFATAMAKRHRAVLSKLSSTEKCALDEYADQLLKSLEGSDEYDSH